MKIHDCKVENGLRNTRMSWTGGRMGGYDQNALY